MTTLVLPLLVKMEDDPDSLPGLVDLVDILVSRYLENTAETSQRSGRLHLRDTLRSEGIRDEWIQLALTIKCQTVLPNSVKNTHRSVRRVPDLAHHLFVLFVLELI